MSHLLYLVLVAIMVGLVSLGNTPPRWPNGRYGLPQSIHGCPDTDTVTWSTGSLSQFLGKKNKKSTSFHMAANVSNTSVQRTFCIKETTDTNTTRPQWPTGKYCIYRKGRKCPEGLRGGSLQWDNMMDFSVTKHSGVLPDGTFTHSVSLIYFCCAVKGYKSHPITLPLEKPFYLMAYESDVCQAVTGALSRAEFIVYKTGSGNRLYPPHPYRAYTYNIKMYYCYYQACWTNFTSLSGVITSPFYPTDYPQSTNCRWTITLPQGFHITLHFEDVDLEPSSSCNKDWISVRLMNGTTIKYCNESLVYPVVFQDLDTETNVVVLEFHSDQASTVNKGFRVLYTSVYNPVTTIGPATHEQPSPSTLNATTETLLTTPNAKTTAEDITEHTTQHPTEFPSSTQAKSSGVVGETRQAQSYDAWTVIVAVCLVILVVAIVLVVVYFKCLRKRRNHHDESSSAVKYCKEEEGAYVDIDYPRNSVFGAKINPGLPAYDRYPSDRENEKVTQVANQEAANPIYEKIEENEAVSEEKSQDNLLYGGSLPNGVNIYEELPNPRKKQNNLYESTSLPR